MMRKLFSVNRLVVFIVIIITIIFLLPLFLEGFSGIGLSQLFFDTSNGFTSALLRTFFFALLSAVFNVTIGFLLAVFLSKISLFSKIGKQISLFILPITLGNVAIVFVFKVILFNSTFFNFVVEGGYTTQNVFLLLIQFWQFGFLFAYLFMMSIHSIPKRLHDYSEAVGLTSFEKMRDIILPHSKNLFILLLFIGFIFSFYEDTKSQFIFRASQGMGTELINHWLYRTYQSNLLINAVYANQSIFKIGLIIFVMTLLVFLVLGKSGLVAFNLFSKINFSKHKSENQNTISNFRFYLVCSCIAIIVIPVIIALARSHYKLSENIISIFFPFVLTLIAAFAATVFAIAFGIASRLVFRKMLSSFNSKSLFYFLTIFLLQIIPPLCIVLCGFKWLSWIGYNSDLLIYTVWIVGHCFLTLPLLGSFLVATHFSVRGNELNYQSAYRISNSNIVQYSFLKRFKAEYIFTLLFAFTFIWNDAGLNMILSDRIPSFAANLQMLFIGRAADYSKATGFVLVAVVLSLTCVFIWQYIISKASKFNNTNEATEI